MGEVTIIGLDIAKSVFQAHGADAVGAVLFRKKLGRGRLLAHSNRAAAEGLGSELPLGMSGF
jgi:transposase